MRIAAGVLLIIVAIMNLFTAMGYTAGGAAGGALVEAAELNVQTIKKMPNAKKADIEAADKALADLKSAADTAGGLVGFGIFLFVLVGLQIAGAVVLFRSKAAKFAMVVAVLTVVGELGGFAFGMPFNIMKIPGLLAAVFAFLGAKSYADNAGGAAEA